MTPNFPQKSDIILQLYKTHYHKMKLSIFFFSYKIDVYINHPTKVNLKFAVKEVVI